MADEDAFAPQDEFDIGGEASASPSETLEALHSSLEEAIALEEAVAQMEDDLKAAKATLHKVKSVRIPDLMDQLQMDEVKFRGWSVKVQDFVSGSLPKDPERRKKALQWLEDNDAAGLIKTEVKVAFGKSQHNEALSVAAQLESQGHAPNVDSGVHSATLQSFARQRIKDGDPIDTEALGLYVGKVAKLKRSG